MKQKKDIDLDKNKITRKEAIRRTGKYAAYTAVGLFTVLSPMESQAGSMSPEIPSW